MELTGQQLLQGLSEFLSDWQPGTTTSAGTAEKDTLVDSSLRRFQDRRLMGRYVRITESGANQYEVRTVDNNAQATGTLFLTDAMPTQVSSDVSYELHRYDPSEKFRALNKAVYTSTDYVYDLIYDEHITGDGYTTTFPIPEDIDLGPVDVWVEEPVAALNLIWNFVNNALGTDLNYWTACECTPSIVQQFYTDLVVPKYDWACTRIDVPGTQEAIYAQEVANMSNGITAASAAGRQMASAAWVYCDTPNRVYLELVDDDGATYSAPHLGKGWQLLNLEKDIVNSNSLILTTRLRITTGDPVVLFWNRWWLYYGNRQRVTENYSDLTFPSVRRDATTQTFTLPRTVQRGYQMRVVGKHILNGLGDNPDTQPTVTLNVTEQTAEILYAKAARLLLEWEGLTTSDVPEIYERIQLVESHFKSVRKLGQFLPTRGVHSPYFR